MRAHRTWIAFLWWVKFKSPISRFPLTMFMLLKLVAPVARRVQILSMSKKIWKCRWGIWTPHTLIQSSQSRLSVSWEIVVMMVCRIGSGDETEVMAEIPHRC